MHVLAAVITAAWFLLTALLWYARPGDVAWFGGSMILGVAYFLFFFWYVTRPK